MLVPPTTKSGEEAYFAIAPATTFTSETNHRHVAVFQDRSKREHTIAIVALDQARGMPGSPSTPSWCKSWVPYGKCSAASSDFLSGFCSHSLPPPPFSGSSKTEDQALALLRRHRRRATLLKSQVALRQHPRRVSTLRDKHQVTLKVHLLHLNNRSRKCNRAATLNLCSILRIPPQTSTGPPASTTISLKISRSRQSTLPIVQRCLHLHRNSMASPLFLEIEDYAGSRILRFC